MRKGNLVKRKHSPQKDTVSCSSSNEEEQGKSTWLHKKNSSQGKKPKERTSPATSENEDKISVDESSDNESNTVRKDNLDHSKVNIDTAKEVKSSSKEVNTTEPLSTKEQEEQNVNMAKTENTDKQLVASIEDKMNISGSKTVKPKKNMYLFDFLGDEVSNDESQALQALSSFWVTTVARNKDVLKRLPPKNQQEQDFYNKYCDKQGKLTITAATRLMSLPHVITVCLKTTAQIEVVVVNREKALEECEELRQDFFEVVEAMAMHLM